MSRASTPGATWPSASNGAGQADLAAVALDDRGAAAPVPRHGERDEDPPARRARSCPWLATLSARDPRLAHCGYSEARRMTEQQNPNLWAPPRPDPYAPSEDD